MTTPQDKLTSTPEGRRLYQREETVQALTDTICELMADKGVSRTELSLRLGRDDDWVGWVLDGKSSCLELRSCIDIFTALGSRVVFRVEPL